MHPSKIISLIKQCKTLRTLKLIHAAMIVRSNLHSNLYLTTNLITHYSSLGSISHSYILFSQSHSQDLFLYNVMIQCFTTHSNHQKSVSLYRQMKRLGIKPDNFTFPFVLKGYGYLGGDDTYGNVGKMIHKDVVQFGYELDLYVGNSVISMYSKLGQVELCRKVFDEMLERSVVSWNVMVGAYALNGFYQEGLSLFYAMLRDGILPNKAGFLGVMRCVYNEDDACEIGRVVVDYGWEEDQSVRSAMMGVYSRCGRLDIARRIFDEIRDKDMITWSSMIEAYAQAELPIEALELFKQMRVNRMELDFVTILSVIRATSSLASFRQSRFLHGAIIRSSQQGVLVVETSLVDLYVKSGSLEYARKVFDRMRDKNLLTWSSMISGYGMHGRGQEALDLFDEMKVSVQPDQITFVSVLSACSHSGLVDEGWRCFRSMTKDFGLAPRSEHYACMVDLLGRSGRLSEAKELIETMPIKPDSTVWGSLLGACRLHSNVELAELAAKSLFELDPENPGRYVLLSNIYKSSGKKEEAAQVRSLMKQRNVRKIAGHTIIEVKNMMYTFVIGDRSNPQTELIYKELEILMEKIREEGYIPDTNFVLHDVDEEIKEKMLYVHSEKLAIVFGLLNSAPTSVIRIKKNLRVCGDCHSATKFISKVTKREIVVRDAHRFHHFKDGVCSCGDYW